MLALGISLGDALLGASMGMTVSVSVSESGPRAHLISMLLCSAAAIAAVCIAALASQTPWLASTLLCAVVFASVVGRARGPRASAVGMLAFMGYFFALFIVARPAQIPSLAASIALGCGAAIVIHFAIVRENVVAVRESVLSAFRSRMQLLFDELVNEIEFGEASERRLQRIRRQTGKLNEIALALEEAAGRSDQAAPAQEARTWLLQLLDAEVGVDMLADSVHRITADKCTAQRRRTLVDTVRALQRWIDVGSPETRAEVERALADASPDREAATNTSDINRAVALLLADRPWSKFPALADNTPRLSVASFRGGGGGMAGMQGSWPNLRLAVQATVAVALAIVAGRAISDQRWYWAVLAAFVVFIRATTFAETVSRAWQRVFGTVVGVTLGTLLAALLRRHATVEIVVALLAVFVGYALLRVSYGGMMLFITIALALLYEMMGQPVQGLMELRLAETAAGAFIGVVVAGVVFPMHSSVRVRRLVADLLREVALVINDTTTANARDASTLHDRIRSVDRALAEVRNAVRPLWAPHVPWESKQFARLTRTAAALAYVTRRTRTERAAAIAQDSIASEPLRIALARNCNAVADALITQQPPTLVDTAHLLAAIEDPKRDPGATARFFRDIDVLVRRLAFETSDVSTAEWTAPFDGVHATRR